MGVQVFLSPTRDLFSFKHLSVSRRGSRGFCAGAEEEFYQGLIKVLKN